MSTSSFGHRLAQLRRRRGLSQQQLANQLCAASGTTTITRNEISRWERGLRVPTPPWLGWLALVLQTKLVLQQPLEQPKSVPIASDTASKRWAVLRKKVKVRSPGVWPVTSTH